MPVVHKDEIFFSQLCPLAVRRKRELTIVAGRRLSGYAFVDVKVDVDRSLRVTTLRCDWQRVALPVWISMWAKKIDVERVQYAFFELENSFYDGDVRRSLINVDEYSRYEVNASK